ncbi:MAG TPA: VOC family protein [Gaiellaceae bacterium]|nr:VOC family protein [Gaiellaceae bacterium]
MFDHVTIRVSDRAASESFYDTVLGVLGIAKSTGDFAEWGDFSIAPATADSPPTQHLHIGFVAASQDDVDEFWRVGVDAGYVDDGPPGPRPEYDPDYYGAFLLDPDGNSAEAVHHGDGRERDSIDHVWMRVPDLEASRRFYDLVAPFGGFSAGSGDAGRVSFRGTRGSFTIVPGPATSNVHLAFPTTENVTVDAFHAAATSAGYRDNGGPGERPIYHTGYYGAFVLDPDGHNVEVVNHNRGGDV